MLSMLQGFKLAPAGPASPITGGLSAQAAAGMRPPPALASAFAACAREGELKASADKAFVATLGFLAGALYARAASARGRGRAGGAGGAGGRAGRRPTGACPLAARAPAAPPGLRHPCFPCTHPPAPTHLLNAPQATSRSWGGPRTSSSPS